jgi:bifunctional non-homologous end joining protein LigD
VAAALERRDPTRFTTRFAKAGRQDKLLVDYLRNNRTNTSVAAYSTRAKPNATVSLPLAWPELTASRTPERFTMETVPRRLSRLRRDPWAGYWRARQTIPRSAIRALERL